MQPCRVSAMGGTLITQHSYHTSIAVPEPDHGSHDVLKHLQANQAQQ